VGALDPDIVDFGVLDLEILALRHLIAAPDILLGDRIIGLGVDELLLEPVSGFLVDPVERHPLGARRRRVERDRA